RPCRPPSRCRAREASRPLQSFASERQAPRPGTGTTVLNAGFRAAKRTRAPRATVGGDMRHLGRSIVVATLVGVACLGLMGMGALGGGREEAPARDFHAVLTDADGTRIDADRVTTGASASLDGDLGRGRLRIPFDNIERVTFKPATDHDRVVADVK